MLLQTPKKSFAQKLESLWRNQYLEISQTLVERSQQIDPTIVAQKAGQANSYERFLDNLDQEFKLLLVLQQLCAYGT